MKILKSKNIRQFVLKSALTLATVSVVATAQAAPSGGSSIYLDETFFPVWTESNDTRSTTGAPGVATLKGTGFDARTTLGYVFSDRFLVGLTYNYYSLTEKRGAVSGGDSSADYKTTKSEWGPTLGYFWGQGRVALTYFISGEKEVVEKNADASGLVTGNSTMKNTKMSGFQFVVGYSFPVSTWFEIGPTLAYRSVSYKTQSKTNVIDPTDSYTDRDLFTKHVETSLDPMVTLVFRF